MKIVTAVEALGPESIVIGKRAGSSPNASVDINARLSRHARAEVGQTIRLHADLTPMHLFDPRTEKVLPRESSRAGDPAHPPRC